MKMLMVFQVLYLLFKIPSVLSFSSSSSSSCLGPPYFYATFHGGSSKSNVNQIIQYSRDGCILNDAVLNIDNTISLRGMTMTTSGKLIVNNAYKEDSAVLLFDSCNNITEGETSTSSSTREYLNTITGSLVDDDGANADYYLLHPYGAAYYNSRVYVTNQDSCTITSYLVSEDNDNSQASNEDLIASFYPCNVDDSTTSELRGITFDNSGVFYVAYKQADLILVYNATTKHQLGTRKCTSCIGITYDANTNSIFAGSSDDDKVHQYKAWPDLDKIQTFSNSDHLGHPSGVTVYNDVLYVGSQETSRIVSFNITNNDYLGTIVKDFEDTIEDLTLSFC
mmetsp:Transcript_17070/g.20092  ORF Transcript_17070/g.20092 Transcript_17070/m.20092 type:complete len:337 (-) Transcript_17070:194-1204(-)